MPIDRHAQELLERYPDDLDPAEGEALAAIAARDPDVAAILSELDALEAERPPGEWAPAQVRVRLEPEARARMDAVLARRVADAEPARRPTTTPPPWWMVVAALFAVTLVWWSVQPTPPPGVRLRGDAWVGTATLFALDPDGPLPLNAERPVDAPIVFQVMINTDAHLLLIEERGAQHNVVWPQAELTWEVGPGVHMLEPPGSSPEFFADRPGDATYVLYAGRDRLDPDHLEGARRLDSVSVRWRVPAP